MLLASKWRKTLLAAGLQHSTYFSSENCSEGADRKKGQCLKRG